MKESVSHEWMILAASNGKDLDYFCCNCGLIKVPAMLISPCPPWSSVNAEEGFIETEMKALKEAIWRVDAAIDYVAQKQPALARRRLNSASSILKKLLRNYV